MSAENVKAMMREVLADYSKRGPGFLQTAPVLEEVSRRLNCRGDIAKEQLILTAWHQLLVADGILAWGYDLSNPGPPFVHFTPEGRESLGLDASPIGRR